MRAENNEPLCRACQNGHLDVVRYLHGNGAKMIEFIRYLRGNRVELNARDGEPLCRACEGGHLEVVRYLRGNGVELNARDGEPLCRACEGGHLEVVRYLHENGLKLNVRKNEPLLRACDRGHLDIVRYLQQNGVSLEAPDNEPLCRAAAAGHLEVSSLSPSKRRRIARRDNEPLCRAAAAGHLELVRYIHQNGGDISARENEPLRRAAAGKHASVVRYLHDAGAATQSLTADARHSIDQMKHEMQAAPAVDHPSAFWNGMGEVNERILGWSGEGNFKRTLNQNYFNFIPIAPDDPRMVRLRRLVPDFTQNTLDRYAIEDPDRDPSSWMSFYPNYYIFKDPDGARKRELYREYLALMYEYALRRDRSGLLATLDEPTLGNPIGVHRNGRLISQDLVNSVRERNSIIGAMEANTDTHFTLARTRRRVWPSRLCPAEDGEVPIFRVRYSAGALCFAVVSDDAVSQTPRLSISPLRHVRGDRERIVPGRPRFLHPQSADEISSRLFRFICEHQLNSRNAARSNQALYGTHGADHEVRALPETAERLRESRR